MNTWLKDYCSVPTVWCRYQQPKSQDLYRYEVTSPYEEQHTAPGISGFLEKGEGMVFCEISVF
jgi:hypothetical protein